MYTPSRFIISVFLTQNTGFKIHKIQLSFFCAFAFIFACGKTTEIEEKKKKKECTFSTYEHTAAVPSRTFDSSKLANKI